MGLRVLAALSCLALPLLLSFTLTDAEVLRAAPDAALTVNSSADDNDGACQQPPAGDCTLREAINAANASVGVKETIKFNIPGAGVHTINVSASGLPPITDPVIINGYTQPGAHANTLAEGDDAVLLIELNGAGASGRDGLTITAGNSTVKGLVINRFVQSSQGGAAFHLETKGGNIISGNFLGTDANGTGSPGGNSFGVLIFLDSPNNLVGGTDASARNLVSKNSYGVAILSASGNLVQGNFLGTDRNGTVALGNGSAGVQISTASNNTIGGAVARARNVISGNQYGVRLLDDGQLATVGNIIQGNLIGTKVNGAEALANTQGGIQIQGGQNTRIGGTTAAARNIISGNGGDGIYLGGWGGLFPDGNLVQGNYIGTDASGKQDLGNAGIGVHLAGSTSNTIGGAGAGAGNVISGNGEEGVFIEQNTSTGNHILGNLIGVKATGSGDLHNDSDGIYLGASNNFVGGRRGGGNVIAFNHGAGVFVIPAANANAILRNSLFQNSQLGINLVSGSSPSSGVNPNDVVPPPDSDTGANNLQNFPVLNTATSASSTITGQLLSTPSTKFRLEFFSSPTCDPSGSGEGKLFLGAKNLTTNGIGKANFNFVSPIAFRAGQAITATATDPSGNTSEFSACKTAS